jgi:Flp pilus assembly secretin CpaC/tetratricopeptide (TPR) repeat protein
VKLPAFQTGSRALRTLHRIVKGCIAALLLAILPAAGVAQAAEPVSANPVSASPVSASPVQASPAAQTSPAAAPASPSQSVPSAAPADSAGNNTKPEKLPRTRDRRRATKLFLDASKHFQNEQFDQALTEYQQAAALDPTNRNYALAVELTRSHAVTALIQAAAKDRIRGDSKAELAALQRALELDPRNIQVTEHLRELGDDAVRGEAGSIYEQGADTVGASVPLEPSPGVHSFHLHTDQRTAIQQVFKAYGLQPTVHDSIRFTQVRLDIDDATFEQAIEAISLLTNSFYVPLDAHRVLIARDTTENRRQFERLDLETIYLPGLASAELTEVGTLAKNVFDVQQSALDPSAGTITLRAPASTLNAFNTTIRELIDGHSQVLLEVSLIQIAHTSTRNTGVRPPQSVSAFNVYTEEQSILNANQSLVQQIISSGLAAPGDTLAILGILIASGQVSSSLFSGGFALFGGGITASALAPGTLNANFDLNSSDSRELDHMLLRMSDSAATGTDSASATIKSGTRYPIQTSSFSGLSGSLPNIPGLTGAGSSSSLSSLLGSLGSSVPNVPQIQYEDLGLTLKATPKVMRNGDVALNIDMKIDALAGSSINGNPILANRAYSGVVTLKPGSGIVVVSELDKQESRAISGVPGLSEIPGLNNLTGIDNEKNSSTLLIVMSPHVIRGPQAFGHSPMMRVERTTVAH